MAQLTTSMEIMGQVAELRSRMKEDKNLQPFCDVLDDTLLTGFIRGKKDDINKTIECLRFFIHVRSEKYKTFTNAYRPSTIPLLDSGMFNVLKDKDPQGRVVAVIRSNKWIPAETPFQEMVATALFIMDEGIRTDFSRNLDLIFIFDCAGFSFEHVRQIGYNNLVMLMDMFIRSMPNRPKAFHLVNHGVLIYNILRLIKPLLEKKIRERFYMHSNNFESLHQYIPATSLPTWLGGLLSDEDAFDRGQHERIRGNDEFYENLGRIN